MTSEDNVNGGFWTVGRIAAAVSGILATIATAIGIWTWIQTPVADLVVNVEVASFHQPKSLLDALETMASEANRPWGTATTLDKAVKRLDGSSWRANPRNFEQMARIVVHNKGKLVAEDIKVPVPFLYGLVSIDDNDPIELKFKNSSSTRLAIGDIEAGDRRIIYAWSVNAYKGYEASAFNDMRTAYKTGSVAMYAASSIEQEPRWIGIRDNFLLILLGTAIGILITICVTHYFGLIL